MHRHPARDLTQNFFSLQWWGNSAALVALIIFTAVLVFSEPGVRTPLDAPTQPSPRQTQMPDEPSIALPSLESLQSAALAHQRPIHAGASPWTHTTVTLSDRQTLSDALSAAGFAPRESFLALQVLDEHVPVKRVRPGFSMTVVSRGQSTASIDLLLARPNFDTKIVVSKTQDGFVADKFALETGRRSFAVQTAITNSIYLAAEANDVPAATIISLIRALSYRVDFQRDIRSGDTLSMLYDVEMAADGASRPGRIDFAALDLGDRTVELYRFKHPKTNRIDYFDTTGESMRRLLMRTPIDGARLTSSFGKRKHPVLGYVRSHPGVDFGARTGTPIYAAGDGVIERANRFGSYGNYIRIRHAKGFKTAYAHLSRFAKGIKAGKRVQQGQTIGYVGATGRVTGPHLHYEVYNGKNRVNPMRLDLPTGEKLSGEALKAFMAHKTQIDAKRKALTLANIAPSTGAPESAGGADPRQTYTQ